MRLRPPVSLATFLAGLGLIAIAGCDSAPGVGDIIPSPPVLSAFSFTPVEFEHTGDGDTAQIPLALEVQVDNPGGRGLSVEYFVRRQFETTIVGQGALTGNASGGLFTGGQTLSIPRGEIGMYVITVTAVDDGGNVGNEATGLLRFASENLGPPVIIEVIGPSEFQPPGELQLIAVVTDPDGLGNVASVIVTTPTGVPLQMFDDGISVGDEVAGDGRYTATFDVPEATPGDQTFTFVATDNFGVESEEVSFTITILPTL